MIEKPKISKDFNVEDIHKIREYHYLLRKEIGNDDYKKRMDEIIEDFSKNNPNVKIVKISDLNHKS